MAETVSFERLRWSPRRRHRHSMQGFAFVQASGFRDHAATGAQSIFEKRVYERRTRIPTFSYRLRAPVCEFVDRPQAGLPLS